jgi:D-sedoheptulose 7-phosphate isomerase
VRRVEDAHGQGARTLGLTGKDGGKMPGVCDVCVTIPHSVTARIQEAHIAILHIWCELLEEALFGEK